jgi:hypothetical protein
MRSADKKTVGDYFTVQRLKYEPKLADIERLFELMRNSDGKMTDLFVDPS